MSKMKDGAKKYIPFQQIDLPDRQWPNRVIEKAQIGRASCR